MDREPQTARERAVLLLRATLLPGRLPTTSQGLVWAIRGAIVLGVLALIASAVDRSLWEWLELLIVPAVIAGGGIWFNRQQQERQREDNRQQRERELEIAERRTQDEALQAYLDKMTELLVDKNLGQRQNNKDRLENDPVRTVAWARTKTVLRRLDGNRKGAVVRFLREAHLIKKGHPVIRSLSGADLSKANLKGSVLEDTALEGVDLRGAILREAGLRGSVLRKADLTGADLTDTDLTDTQVTEEQLVAAKSLKGATMPNGQKYEDWLKSKDSEENKENNSP